MFPGHGASPVPEQALEADEGVEGTVTIWADSPLRLQVYARADTRARRLPLVLRDVRASGT
jgi:hypothetical protein